MRIRVGTLRKLIREVTMSPSIAKNNKLLDSAMADHDVAGLVDRLDGAFEQALTLDLVLRQFQQHYDADTRDFDDATYEGIKKTVAAARTKANDLVKRDIEAVWKAAHEKAAPAAAPAPTQKPAAVKAA